MTLTRRAILAATAAASVVPAAACATTQGAAGPSSFVRVQGQGFVLNGRPYRFVGANMWYAAYLGADAAYGNRGRLTRELDTLAETGVTNIRLMASSEDSPLRNSVTPTFRDRTGDYNETLLKGLDLTLAEMGERDMKAVLALTNFWEWSGGMMTYLYWVNGGQYLNMNDPAHPWPQFPDFNAAFYTSGEAQRLYRDYIRAVVTRTNTVTGVRYADDPTIMSWQLANEPRPGGSNAIAAPNLPAFYAWIEGTAAYIKSLDPHHLVSTGSEGLKGCIEREDCVVATHAPASIDYVTAHIWPQNWSWVDQRDLPGTAEAGRPLVDAYIRAHIDIARRLNKPLVIEEFGYPRDGGLNDPSAPTTFKDRYYTQIFDAVLASVREGGPLAGSNFWAWNGEGRAQHADHRFQPGDTSFVGDPPHEPQGWYGVFDSDVSTRALIRAHAAALAAS